jgi:hypothetical protein
MDTADALADRSVPTLVVTTFGVVAEPRTYRNLLYLLLSFPLGTLYFTVLVTVGAVVVGLGPFGVVLAPLLLPVVHGLAWLERAVTEAVLDVEVPTEERPVAWLRRAREDPPGVDSLLAEVKRLALARHTWTRLVYLLAKFPLGVAALVAVSFMGTLSVVLVATPLLYDRPQTSIQVLRPIVQVVVPVVERAGVSVGGTPTLAVSGTVHEVETLPGALMTSVAGVVYGVASLHLFNAAARASGWLASVMVRSERPGR